MTRIRTRRVYDAPADDEGLRVLVDRLWPRGIRKEELAFDMWAKDAAPSTELRTWWNHDGDRFSEFADRYRAELANSPGLRDLEEAAGGRAVVTLLYAARDRSINHAVVLRDELQRRLG